MIEDPPLLKIRRNFPRPSNELIAAFAGVPTGHVVDTMGGLGCLDCRIKPLVQSKEVMVGTAVTCYTGPSDNLALFGALHAYNALLDSHFALSDGWETILRDQFLASCNDPNMMWLLVKDGRKSVGLLIAGVHTDSHRLGGLGAKPRSGGKPPVRRPGSTPERIAEVKEGSWRLSR